MTIIHSLLVDIMGIYYSKDCCEILYTYMYWTRVTSLPLHLPMNKEIPLVRKYCYTSIAILALMLHMYRKSNVVMKMLPPNVSCCDKKRGRNLRNPKNKEHYFYHFSSLSLLEYLNVLWLSCFYIPVNYYQLLQCIGYRIICNIYKMVSF